VKSSLHVVVVFVRDVAHVGVHFVVVTRARVGRGRRYEVGGRRDRTNRPSCSDAREVKRSEGARELHSVRLVRGSCR